ncbi:unnamed protein product, partial [Polarella glacialis]
IAVLMVQHAMLLRSPMVPEMLRCDELRSHLSTEHSRVLSLQTSNVQLDLLIKRKEEQHAPANANQQLQEALAKSLEAESRELEVLAKAKLRLLEDDTRELQLQLKGATTPKTLAPLDSDMTRQQESRIPPGLVFSQSYSQDPEGVYFYELDKIVERKANGSFIDCGTGHGRMLKRYGARFRRVVAIDPDATLIQDTEKSLSNSVPKHPDLSFHTTGAAEFETLERFDFALLSMVLQHATTKQAKLLMAALGKLLEEDGLAVISTTHVEEGAAFFIADTGERIPEIDFDLQVALRTLSKTHQFPTRYWTKSQLEEVIVHSGLEVVDHVRFTYNTFEYAAKSWRADTKARSFVNLRDVPSSQMFVVRRARKGVFFNVATPLAPSSPNARLVVMSLLRGGFDHSDYVHSQDCLRQAWNKSVDGKLDLDSYDNLVFHEGNINASVQEDLRSKVPNLRFADVRDYGGFDTKFENASDPLQQALDPSFEKGGGVNHIGYYHMCRFYAMQWFHAVRSYEYAMRLDQDVCVTSIPDVLSTMREHGADYAYGLYTEELHQRTVVTIQPWLDYFFWSRGITPKTQPVDAQYMYFTNFFVAKVSWWFQQEVQAFLEAVDRSGGIFAHRWGDAPIQSAVLRTFANPKKVLHMFMDYSHGSTANEIVNGSLITKASKFSG